MSGASILACDLGTTLGWARRASSGDLDHGHTSFQALPHRAKGHRFYAFLQFLARQWAEEPLGALVYEEITFSPVGSGFAQAQVFGGFEGVLLTWCETKGIAYHPVHPMTLKKFLTGSGKAKKPDMLAAIAALGYIGVHDHNEADALALLRYFEYVIAPKLAA